MKTLRDTVARTAGISTQMVEHRRDVYEQREEIK
jgi:hypothetical protein